MQVQVEGGVGRKEEKESSEFRTHTTAALLVPRLYSGTTNGLSSPTGWLGRSLYPLAY